MRCVDGFGYEILELSREICNEPWARRIRRKQAFQNLKKHIKEARVKIRALAEKIKEGASSTSAALGNAARRLHLR